MLKKLERAVLARILPKADAAAFCLPWNRCVWCGAGAYRKVCLMADCTETSTGCNIPCPQHCA